MADFDGNDTPDDRELSGTEYFHQHEVRAEQEVWEAYMDNLLLAVQRIGTFTKRKELAKAIGALLTALNNPSFDVDGMLIGEPSSSEISACLMWLATCANRLNGLIEAKGIPDAEFINLVDGMATAISNETARQNAVYDFITGDF